ncbi:MAG: ANTAR domain-containing protein [Actinomycetes bacterium]
MSEPAGGGLDLGLARAFVELADTLVDDFDTIDFLHKLTLRTVDLLHAEAAGVMVTDKLGHLRMVAASSEQARLLELFELQSDEGPCLDCFRTGVPVQQADLTVDSSRWPRFASVAREAGYHAVSAVPMRLRNEVIGALNLFSANPAPASPFDMRLGQAMADVATIGLLQQRAVDRRELLAEQLQTALYSRVVIEQAKGVLAERSGLGMDEAFTLLRDHARDHRSLLSDLARDVVDRAVQIPLPTSTRDGPAES